MKTLACLFLLIFAIAAPSCKGEDIDSLLDNIARPPAKFFQNIQKACTLHRQQLAQHQPGIKSVSRTEYYSYIDTLSPGPDFLKSQEDFRKISLYPTILKSVLQHGASFLCNSSLLIIHSHSPPAGL